MSDRPGEILSPDTYRALQDAAITLLRMAATKLREAQLDDTLREHGWSEQVCHDVADLCTELAAKVASDYPFSGKGLMASEIERVAKAYITPLIAEYINPSEMGELQAAALDAEDALGAFITVQDGRLWEPKRRRERGASNE